MVSNFDHVAILVTDLEEAERFFGLLGFVEDQAVVISGEAMDAYMGMSNLEADHITMVIPDSKPRQEVQLLRLHSPKATIDDGSGNLARTGFNHVCFRVPNLDEALATMLEAGIRPRKRADVVPRPEVGVPQRPEQRRRRTRRMDLTRSHDRALVLSALQY